MTCVFPFIILTAWRKPVYAEECNVSVGLNLVYSICHWNKIRQNMIQTLTLFTSTWKNVCDKQKFLDASHVSILIHSQFNWHVEIWLNMQLFMILSIYDIQLICLVFDNSINNSINVVTLQVLGIQKTTNVIKVQ